MVLAMPQGIDLIDRLKLMSSHEFGFMMLVTTVLTEKKILCFTV